MTQTTTALHSDEELAKAAAEIALDGYSAPGKPDASANPAFRALVDAGSELWLDTGDRDAAAKVWASELRGLTTNNTLVNQVIQTGRLDSAMSAIGSRLRDAYPGLSTADMVMEAAFILNARIALDLVQTFGSKVSVELHPSIAHDWRATVDFGKRYFAICPSNFIIKVPMTPEGFIAVRKLSQAGIPVNYTLGFSARQNYFAGVFSQPAYVNVFLGRLGVLLKNAGLSDGANVGEKVTLATQEALDSLRARCVKTKLIAASLRAGYQVASLAGVNVQTIPPKVAQEYLDSNPDLSSIRRHASADFPVTVSDASRSAHIAKLWEVTDEFKALTDAAARAGDSIKTGAQILDLARQNGVKDFFRDWTADEQSEIRRVGKAPDYARWAGMVAPDDLMTQAALQSFATDQQALDDRVAGRI